MNDSSSVEYSRLEYAIASAGSLIRDLAPNKIESQLDELKLKSYVLLCHAAVEEYLERVSVAVLNESLTAFKTDGKIRDPLVCACSYYKIGLPVEVSTRNPGDLFRDIFERLCSRALSEHASAIANVNGIMTKHQDAMLLPVGVKIFEFDRLLSQKLNALGGTRGGFAHQFGIRTLTPRAGLEADVWSLIRLIQPLDNELCKRADFVYL